MARDCGATTHEDIKRSNKREKELQEKLKAYRDAQKQAFTDLKNACRRPIFTRLF
jgi:hypothetical protein